MSHSLLKRSSVFLGIEDLERLLFVRLGVRFDFLARQGRPCSAAAGRVADQRGRCADYEDHGMSAFLKVPELSNDNRVAEMDIRRGGVKTGLDPQRPSFFPGGDESLLQFVFGDDLDEAPAQIFQLLVDGHGWGGGVRTGMSNGSALPAYSWRHVGPSLESPERVVPLRPLPSPHDPAARDTELAAQYNVNRFGIESMLLGKNAR